MHRLPCRDSANAEPQPRLRARVTTPGRSFRIEVRPLRLESAVIRRPASRAAGVTKAHSVRTTLAFRLLHHWERLDSPSPSR
jgi:hypothetical protein